MTDPAGKLEANKCRQNRKTLSLLGFPNPASMVIFIWGHSFHISELHNWVYGNSPHKSNTANNTKYPTSHSRQNKFLMPNKNYYVGKRQKKQWLGGDSKVTPGISFQDIKLAITDTLCMFTKTKKVRALETPELFLNSNQISYLVLKKYTG